MLVASAPSPGDRSTERRPAKTKHGGLPKVCPPHVEAVGRRWRCQIVAGVMGGDAAACVRQAVASNVQGNELGPCQCHGGIAVQSGHIGLISQSGAKPVKMARKGPGVDLDTSVPPLALGPASTEYRFLSDSGHAEALMEAVLDEAQKLGELRWPSSAAEAFSATMPNGSAGSGQGIPRARQRISSPQGSLLDCRNYRSPALPC